MNFFTFSFLGILGLLIIALLFSVFALIARSLGALVKTCTKSHEQSAKYGAQTTNVIYGMLIIFICYQIYTALFPGTGFYLDELQVVTERQPPAGAKIIARDVTYPDLHGDYCSFSRIRLTELSYHNLLNELKKDNRFLGDGNGEISKGGLSANNLKPLRIVGSFLRPDIKTDHHYRISFLENGTDIEIAVCVT